MLLRARVVLPVTAPPLGDGAVLVSGGRIAAVGPWPDLRRASSGTVTDLGDVILLPGLINAHCHLEYTGFAGHLPPPRSFTDWIKGVLALKAGWGWSEFALSWLAGARQMLASGATTVVDVAAVPELLPEVREATPLRIVSCLEMTGLRRGRPPERTLGDALALAGRLRVGHGAAGLSPHAPYSTTARLVTLAAQAARERGLPLTIHAAESVEEFSMFMHRRGPMHDWLAPQRDMGDCGLGSPVAHLARCDALGPHTLLAHVNYLDGADAPLLAESGTSVVHCPQSHAYFGHQRFPREVLERAGVNVCLGTDSLLSTRVQGRTLPRLSLFDELRACAAAKPAPEPGALLRAVTVNPARALGLAGRRGELRPHADADLIAIPYAGAAAAAAAYAVTAHAGPVAASMIAGEWAMPPAGHNQ
ncbi:MAG: amidohydrolase family protein [Limisphaerales bacterium]